MTMHTAIDWTATDWPWSVIGPEWAIAARALAAGGHAAAPRVRSAQGRSTKLYLPRPALRAARLAVNLSRAAVGEMLGICAQNISNWERGANPVPQRHHAALADILGVPIGDLL